MVRDTRKFELQFQWEVDRLVFRHRQRGRPVEVTGDERDRLVERYAARLAIARRAMVLAVVGGAAMIGVLAQLAAVTLYVSFALYGGLILSLGLIEWWTFDETTATLRQRQPIGEALGATGGFVRTVAGIKSRDLWIALAYTTAVGVMFLTSMPGDPARYGSAGIFFVVGALMLLMLLAKGALYERNRLHRQQQELIERARTLGTD